MRFVMIDGRSATDRSAFDHAVRWLFAAIQSLSRRLNAQIMHVGPPNPQASTIARLHSKFLPPRHLMPSGHHHEIYLNPDRVAPEKLKTVLRQPVRPCITAPG